MSEYKIIPSPLEEDYKKVKDLLDLNRDSQNILFEKKLELSKLVKEKEGNRQRISQLKKEIIVLENKINENKNFWKDYHKIEHEI